MAYKKTSDEVQRFYGSAGTKAVQTFLNLVRHDLNDALGIKMSDEQYKRALNVLEPHHFALSERSGVPEDRHFESLRDYATEYTRDLSSTQPATSPDPQPLEQRNPEPTAAPPITRNPDALLAEFKPGGSKYERWLKGDAALNAEHIALYNQKAGNKQIEITTEGTRTFNTENKENIS
jgi:hypothetical protein